MPRFHSYTVRRVTPGIDSVVPNDEGSCKQDGGVRRGLPRAFLRKKRAENTNECAASRYFTFSTVKTEPRKGRGWKSLRQNRMRRHAPPASSTVGGADSVRMIAHDRQSMGTRAKGNARLHPRTPNTLRELLIPAHFSRSCTVREAVGYGDLPRRHRSNRTTHERTL